MEATLAWGLEFVRAVQSTANPFLTRIMLAVTATGSIYCLGALVALLLWCVDYRFGVQVSLLTVSSGFLNSWLKLVFAQPRPYDIDPSVGMIRDVPYGMPSGHAQGTALFWGLVATRVAKPVGIALAVVPTLLVGFSRVYLGVHFPTDVLAGWIIGMAIAAAWIAFGGRVACFIEEQNVRVKVLGAAAVGLVMNFLNRSETGLAGLFVGMALGASFLPGLGGFRAAGGFRHKAARYGVGLAGLAILYFGLKAILPGEGDANYALFRFLRYGLVGVWATLGAPLLFVKLRIAEGSASEARDPDEVVCERDGAE